jgi:ribosome-associated protein
MEKEIKIKDEYIKLEQALKLAGEYSMGSDAKYAVKDGTVKVNGNTELQRGKKLRPGDTFSVNGHDYRISGT